MLVDDADSGGDQGRPLSRILQAQAIVEAVTQLHVRELGGNNCGPEVARYLRSVKLDPGNPWCAAFVFCMYEDAAIALGKTLGGPVFNPLHRTGSVKSMWNHAPVEWRTMSPTRGSVAIHMQAGHNHCGIYLASSPTHAATVEGNTNEAGSREGNSVQVQRRPHSYWTGYIDVSRSLGDA